MGERVGQKSAELDALCGGLVFALDPLGFTHLRAELRDDTDDALDMPLCFVSEARQRKATAAELNLTFDQALDEADYPRTDHPDRVSCPDCREWIHG